LYAVISLLQQIHLISPKSRTATYCIVCIFTYSNNITLKWYKWHNTVKQFHVWHEVYYIEIKRWTIIKWNKSAYGASCVITAVIVYEWYGVSSGKYKYINIIEHFVIAFCHFLDWSIIMFRKIKMLFTMVIYESGFSIVK